LNQPVAGEVTARREQRIDDDPGGCQGGERLADIRRAVDEADADLRNEPSGGNGLRDTLDAVVGRSLASFAVGRDQQCKTSGFFIHSQ
jgi:hypothetical protein